MSRSPAPGLQAALQTVAVQAHLQRRRTRARAPSFAANRHGDGLFWQIDGLMRAVWEKMCN